MNSSLERYAFIALLFLVVVVAVVAFWDDGDSNAEVLAGTREDSSWVDPYERANEAARVEAPLVTPREGAPLRSTADRKGESGARVLDAPRVALNGVDSDLPRVDRVTTIGQSRADHANEPGVREAGIHDLGRPEAGNSGSLAAGDGGRAPLEPMTPWRGDRGAGGPLSLDTPESMRLSRPSTAAPKFDPVTPTVDVKRSAKPEPSNKDTSTADAPAGARTYVVQAGDALSTIAQRECGSMSCMDDIVRLNGLSNRDMIFEGMKLQLPEREEGAVTASVPTVRSPEARTARADGRPVVTIQRGQILGKLLEDRYGTSKRSLPLVVALNPGLNPDRVLEGQSLVLPRLDEVEGASLPAGRGKDGRETAAEAPRLAKNTRPKEGRSAPRKGNFVR